MHDGDDDDDADDADDDGRGRRDGGQFMVVHAIIVAYRIPPNPESEWFLGCMCACERDAGKRASLDRDLQRPTPSIHACQASHNVERDSIERYSSIICHTAITKAHVRE